MSDLLRFILFFTEEEDDNAKDDKKSDVVGKGQVDYMVLQS